MQDPQNLHLVFNARTLDYVVNCIAQRPYAECAQILADINAQVQKQQSPQVAGSEALPVLTEVVGQSVQ
jgi:hypothetical protein